MKIARKVFITALAVGLITPIFSANAASEQTPVKLSIDGKAISIKHYEKNRIFR